MLGSIKSLSPCTCACCMYVCMYIGTYCCYCITNPDRPCSLDHDSWPKEKARLCQVNFGRYEHNPIGSVPQQRGRIIRSAVSKSSWFMREPTCVLFVGQIQNELSNGQRRGRRQNCGDCNELLPY